MKLDLTKGICKNEQYDAWRFPGGEIHVKIKNFQNRGGDNIEIVTRLNTSDDIMLLLLVSDILKKDYSDYKKHLFIPYMPYQQADRDFSEGECFSLKTMANLINSMEFDKVQVYMNHSDVTPSLLNNCKVLDDSTFIKFVISDLESRGFLESELIILSPDAGAFKRVFKLCEKIGFKGSIETCSKSRDYTTQLPTQKIPSFNETSPVLIIDDIVLGGRTFINIANEIKNPCYLAVSHGIFDSGGYGDPMPALEAAFNRIYTTDSRKNSVEYTNEKITVYNLQMLK